jgi:hypothetical protein
MPSTSSLVNVFDLADRIAAMKNAQVVGVGKVEELTSA